MKEENKTMLGMVILVVFCAILISPLLFLEPLGQAEAREREQQAKEKDEQMLYSVWSKLHPEHKLSIEEWRVAKDNCILPK